MGDGSCVDKDVPWPGSQTVGCERVITADKPFLMMNSADQQETCERLIGTNEEYPTNEGLLQAMYDLEPITRYALWPTWKDWNSLNNPEGWRMNRLTDAETLTPTGRAFKDYGTVPVDCETTVEAPEVRKLRDDPFLMSDGTEVEHAVYLGDFVEVCGTFTRNKKCARNKWGAVGWGPMLTDDAVSCAAWCARLGANIYRPTLCMMAYPLVVSNCDRWVCRGGWVLHFQRDGHNRLWL